MNESLSTPTNALASPDGRTASAQSVARASPLTMPPDEHSSEQSSPEPPPSATRDLFANERTLLA
jgi:hypothetical protein